MQTAEIIASKTGSFVSTDEKLIETYCPELQGKKQPLEKAWELEEHHPSRESRQSVLERVKKSFEERINSSKDCIMVSHGDQLTVLYYYLIKKDEPYYFWDEKVSSEKVFRRGEIMKVEIENKELLSIDRILV